MSTGGLRRVESEKIKIKFCRHDHGIDRPHGSHASDFDRVIFSDVNTVPNTKSQYQLIGIDLLTFVPHCPKERTAAK